MSVFYPAGKAELEKEITSLEKQASSKYKEIKKLLGDTRVECPNGHVNKISDLEGTAHMYYVDNVYTGYYALSEYSYICPVCNKRVREYEDPELKKLRPYYKNVVEDHKD